MPNTKDIILKEKKDDEDFFNTYRPSEEVGKNIFDSFMKLYVKGKGFPMSKGKDSKGKGIGIISNCMALSTLLELEDMGVDIGNAQDEFRFLLTSVFDSVYKNGLAMNPVFGTEPYYFAPNAELMIDDYVETASKIMIIMIDLRNYANKMDITGSPFGQRLTGVSISITSYRELVKYAEKLLIDAMRFLIESALSVKETEVKKRMIDDKEYFVRDGLPVEIKYRGWTYCNPGEDDDAYDTSIYYTYHATNAYVELYNAYPKLIAGMFSDIKDNDDEKEEQLSDIEKEINFRNEIFLNTNREIINKFRIITASSGRYIEALLGEKGTDLSYDFVRNDFSGISAAAVIDTQDNNAVINTLFILSIYLNSAIDEDYERLNSDKKNWFYNNLQYAITNIKKIYGILEVDGKQDLIDTYRLDKALFKEKSAADHKEFIKQFRKECENVSVYDLIPLLCNTYTIVFNYLIKYPQLEMTQNLELIMNHCDSQEWLWGDDNGFNINNHLYYVVALENFYAYNKKYEVPLSGNEEQYRLIVKQNNEENEKALQLEKETNESLRRENEKLSMKRSALDTEVEKLAEGILTKLFDEKMEQYIDQVIKDAASFYLQSKRDEKTLGQIEDEIRSKPYLRRALALCGSVSFDEKLLAGNLLDIDPEINSEAIERRLNDNTTKSIAAIFNS